jgi:hypothetical protein
MWVAESDQVRRSLIGYTYMLDGLLTSQSNNPLSNEGLPIMSRHDMQWAADVDAHRAVLEDLKIHRRACLHTIDELWNRAETLRSVACVWRDAIGAERHLPYLSLTVPSMGWI